MLESAGLAFAGYLDDFSRIDCLPEGDTSYDDVLIAIADPTTREKIFQNWSRKRVPFKPLISSDVRLHPSVRIGLGSLLCPGVKITVDVSIGDFVIVNLNSTIGHDVKIGSFSSVMPSVNISGSVSIGKRVFIGSGATILQGLSIGDDAIIAAGAVVTKNVPTGQTVIGVPARPRRK